MTIRAMQNGFGKFLCNAPGRKAIYFEESRKLLFADLVVPKRFNGQVAESQR
jgi:hypothetical protein